MKNIIDAAAGARIGEPVAFRDLTAFPLFDSCTATAGYLTLDDRIVHLSAFAAINWRTNLRQRE